MTEITAPSPVKFAMQFGILFGVIMILQFVIAYSMNIDPVSTPVYGTIINVLNYFILPIVLIAFGCNNYKKANGGYISFGQCLKVGVIICVIAALIYSIFSTVFNLIFPEFMTEMLEKTKSVIISQNPDMSQDQLDIAMTWTEKFMNPAIMIPFTLLMFAFIGLIYSLIIGAIVKKDKPAFN